MLLCLLYCVTVNCHTIHKQIAVVYDVWWRLTQDEVVSSLPSLYYWRRILSHLLLKGYYLETSRLVLKAVIVLEFSGLVSSVTFWGDAWELRSYLPFLNFADMSRARTAGGVQKTLVLLWSPYVIAQTIIFLLCDFYLSSFFPRLISAAVDWMSTILRHMMWP